MPIEYVLAIVAVVAALILLAIIFHFARENSALRRERLEAADMTGVHCRKGLDELRSILEAMNALYGEPDEVRCGEWNERIKKWNSEYVPACTKDPLPLLDCEGDG
ncbi:MAG: hypothetical protein HY722_08600 [Planctomycetes bacterium]|nr:hypothetical protein [Planctomycetota bacterium]